MSSRKSVRIGEMRFGGGAPVRVESMLKSRLEDLDGCFAELGALASAGCELVRVAFPDESLSANLRKIAQNAPIAVMADIHFNHRYALAAIECGCKSIRINPGNMSGTAGLMEVLAAATDRSVAIRIGSNGGSLSARQIDAAAGDRATALVTAVEEQLVPLMERGFENIILSAKSSSVPETLRANFLLAQKYPFPLHIGITEAGPGMGGAVKSATGLGVLLAQGIGDTMRVSLTGDAVAEVETAYAIQRALGLRTRGIDLVSCPGCGRRRVDVFALVEQVRSTLPAKLPDGLRVAVMGCEVNGPKEAAEADIGIAGTQGGYVMFKKGNVIASGKIDTLENALREHLKTILP